MKPIDKSNPKITIQKQQTNISGQQGLDKDLLQAIKEHDLDKLKSALQAKKIDMKATDEEGNTYLHIALGDWQEGQDGKLMAEDDYSISFVGENEYEFWKTLIQAYKSQGGDFNAFNQDGLAPIHYAATFDFSSDCKQLMDDLISSGANINLYTKGDSPVKYTTLALAIKRDNTYAAEEIALSSQPDVIYSIHPNINLVEEAAKILEEESKEAEQAKDPEGGSVRVPTVTTVEILLAAAAKNKDADALKFLENQGKYPATWELILDSSNSGHLKDFQFPQP